MRSSFFIALVAGGLLCLHGGVAQAQTDIFKAQQEQAKAQAEMQKTIKRDRERRERERRAKKEPDSRMERILHPDTEQQFDLTKEKRFGIKGYNATAKSEMEFKTPMLPQKFKAKEFLTGGYHDEKSFWMGDFHYSVGDATTKPRYLFSAPGKTYQTKTAPVKDATDAGKKFADVNVTLPTRDYRGGGAFGRSGSFDQHRFDTPLTPEQATANGYRGELTELKTIDDVRTLLNKNK